MSARDDGWRGVIIQTVWDYTGCTDARAETTCAGIEDRLCTMPAADRLALMRALAPDGWVVARASRIVLSMGASSCKGLLDDCRLPIIRDTQSGLSLTNADI